MVLTVRLVRAGLIWVRFRHSWSLLPVLRVPPWGVRTSPRKSSLGVSPESILCGQRRVRFARDAEGLDSFPVGIVQRERARSASASQWSSPTFRVGVLRRAWSVGCTAGVGGAAPVARRSDRGVCRVPFRAVSACLVRDSVSASVLAVRSAH
jgi:hypothetical protein